jgi:hypothetical protein
LFFFLGNASETMAGIDAEHRSLFDLPLEIVERILGYLFSIDLRAVGRLEVTCASAAHATKVARARFASGLPFATERADLHSLLIRASLSCARSHDQAVAGAMVATMWAYVAWAVGDSRTWYDRALCTPLLAPADVGPKTIQRLGLAAPCVADPDALLSWILLSPYRVKNQAAPLFGRLPSQIDVNGIAEKATGKYWPYVHYTCCPAHGQPKVVGGPTDRRGRQRPPFEQTHGLDLLCSVGTSNYVTDATNDNSIAKSIRSLFVDSSGDGACDAESLSTPAGLGCLVSWVDHQVASCLPAPFAGFAPSFSSLFDIDNVYLVSDCHQGAVRVMCTLEPRFDANAFAITARGLLRACLCPSYVALVPNK